MSARAAVVLLLVVAGCTPLPLPRTGTFHDSDADVGATRILHGGLVLEVRGTRLLIDPWFYSGTLLRQGEPLGLTPDTLPVTAAVLLTDGDDDHFDARALRELAPRVPQALAPPGLRDRLADLGFTDVVAVAPWQEARLGDIQVTAVPSRTSATDTGWVLTSGSVRVLIAGDVADPTELVDVATAFPNVDVAFLPIGGRRVMGVRRSMGPEQAAEAAALLKPTRIVPIDYGATNALPFVWYAGDPVAAFKDACKARGIAADRVVVLAPGESWHWYEATPQASP